MVKLFFVYVRFCLGYWVDSGFFGVVFVGGSGYGGVVGCVVFCCVGGLGVVGCNLL